MAIARGRPAFLVDGMTAHRRPTHHQMVSGLGYVAHQGPPDLPRHARGTKNTDPPAGTLDGSLHVLQPPGEHPPMTMRWHRATKSWAALNPQQGNRLAWPTEHLKKAGWEYVGPAPDA